MKKLLLALLLLPSMASAAKPAFGTMWNTAADPMCAGIIVAYDYNEGSGTVITDSSGNGHNGTINSGPTWTTGDFGGPAITFGSGSISATVSPPADSTFCFSAKPSSISTQGWANINNNGSSSAMYILSGAWKFGGSGSPTGVDNPSVGVRQIICMVGVGGVQLSTLYTDLNGSAAFTNQPLASTIWIGTDNAGFGTAQGVSEFFYLWDHELTGGNVTTLHTDPFTCYVAPVSPTKTLFFKLIEREHDVPSYAMRRRSFWHEGWTTTFSFAR